MSSSLNNSLATFTMKNSELESFAEHLGLTGSDADMFYESYYGIDQDDSEYEYECVFDTTADMGW